MLALATAESSRGQNAPPADDVGKFTIHFENVELPTFVKFISRVTGRKFVFSNV